MDYHFAVPIIPKATVKGLDAAVVASKPKKPNKSKKVSKKINVQHTESIDSESKCLPTKSLSDLCPSCSQIVHQYLAPLQDYINVILKVTENCDEHTIPTRTLSVPHFQNNFIDKSIDTEFDQTKIECHTTQSTYKNSNENPSISTEEINRTTFKNEESDKETTHSNEKNYKLQKYENEVPNVSQHLIPDFKDDNEHILQHSEHHENGVPKSDSINYINENSVYKNNDFLLNKSNQRKQNDSKTSIDYCGNENDEQQSIDNITNEVYQNFDIKPEALKMSSPIKPNEMIDESICPYAYVTIAYNNLSATNAILLANSIQFYNNKVLNVLEHNNGHNKRIVTQFHIPTVILICDTIHELLREIIDQVFDKVMF